ncbi:MAG: integrase core domain-containing protein, partial [Planctomycetaceae bacterium]|nr:integrase core domain-containing protein [Planctomycetaceae bacterium]
SRRVHIAGITQNPDATWITQICRNLTDAEDGVLNDASHLIMDRDPRFVAMRSFVEQNAEAKIVLLPPRSPNLNAFMERWFKSLKSECLGRMIFFSQKSLENAVRQYVEHYHAKCNHQGLANESLLPDENVGTVIGKIQCRERLGGMLAYYHRSAA